MIEGAEEVIFVVGKGEELEQRIDQKTNSSCSKKKKETGDLEKLYWNGKYIIFMERREKEGKGVIR